MRTHNQILVTGATGALGPALAAELIRAKAAESIVVLMRCAPGELEEKFSRWCGAVRELLSPEEYAGMERLYPARGDVCEQGLGLEDGAALQRETDMVIHAAADTNFAAPAERQWAVNVEG